MTLNPMEGFEDLARLDPPSWIVKLAWALWMAFIVAVVIAAMSAPVQAAPVFKSEGSNNKPMSLTLKDGPCTDPTVLKYLVTNVKPELIDKFKEARLLWDGKVWASCWLEFNGIVYSVDEEGTPLQPIPLVLFQDDTV